MGVKITVDTTVAETAWKQLDGTPLTSRKYVEVLNQDSGQRMGLIFTTGSAPTGAWNTGIIIGAGGRNPIEPANNGVKTYVRMESGAVAADGVCLVEWS
jgi:hypothetical protein